MFQDQCKSKSNTWEIILFSLLMFNIYPLIEIMRISGENQRHLRSKTFSSCKKLNSSKNRLVNKNFILVFNFFFERFSSGEFPSLTIGSLSNDDGNSSENGKKLSNRTRCLDWQNNNFARVSRFFCTFFIRLYTTTTTTTLKCLNPRFLEDSNTRQQFFFSFPEL